MKEFVMKHKWKVLLVTILAASLVSSGIIMLTGQIRYTFGESSFVVAGNYFSELQVEYAVIDSVELREQFDAGFHVEGFSNRKLEMGVFDNAEFGQYVRYAYRGCDTAVVLRSGEKIMVLTAASPEQTRQLYSQLLEAIK